MAAVITSDLLTIDACEVNSSWTTVGSFSTAPAVNDDNRLQGSFCLVGRNSNTRGWAGTTGSSPSYDLTDGRHMFIWINNYAPASTDTWANGGIRVFMTSTTPMSLDGAAWPNQGPLNSKQWYLGGSDGLTTGGYICCVVNPLDAGSHSRGSLTASAVSRFGLGVGTISTVATQNRNIGWDVTRIGTGLTITSGTISGPITFTEVYDTDNLVANKYGIVQRQNGIFFLSGKMRIGSTSQATDTVFSDTKQVVVWQNWPVSATFYEFVVQGSNNGGLSTTFQLGSTSGETPINGCTVRGASKYNAADPSPTNSVWTLTCTHASASVKMYDTTFSEMRRAFFNSRSALSGCTFSNFGDIDTGGAEIYNCKFKDVATSLPVTGTYALTIDSPTELNGRIRACQFSNCNRAIRISAAGTYAFDNLTFSNNQYDIENSSTGSVVINATNGSNPATFVNTAGGTTTINNSVLHRLTGLKEFTEVTYLLQPGGTVLFHVEDVGGSGISDYAYNYSGDQTVNIHIFHTGSKPVYIDGVVLGSTNSTIPVSQQADINYRNQ